ncbi:hypothetical protein HALA3H3_810023 [Halomonas sp. A3H3]|nr:hypothetical protein HALA3H3_810023 [Halomonas sp. A3H3]
MGAGCLKTNAQTGCGGVECLYQRGFVETERDNGVGAGELDAEASTGIRVELFGS